MKTKNTLVAVTGLTPQIITSTLYCLNRQKGVEIDEVFVATTSKGRDVILGIDQEFRFKPLKEQIEEMCSKFKFKIPKFIPNKNIIVAEEESVEVPDLRSEEANRIFPNVLCRFIKQQASDLYNTLYCSISGGRKSMGVYLALAISLFGKENDKLVHVLTTPENERNKLPYPLNKTQENEFDLTEIPFVRLRVVLQDFLRKYEEIKPIKEKQLKYSDIVELTQSKLGQEKMIINKTTEKIYYGDNPGVKLEPNLFKLYIKLVENKYTGKDFINIQELENLKEFGDKNNIRSKINKIEKKIIEAIKDPEKAAPYLIHPPKIYGPGNYGIPADLNMFKITQ